MLAKKKQNEETVMVGAKRVRMVRGGSICDPNDRSPVMIKGTLQAATCVTTPGRDPRPRYRVLGKARG